MLDLLLKRYSDINFIMDLPAEDGVALILRAREEEQEDRLMQRWMLHYQDKLSYEEFKKTITTKTENKNLTAEDILKGVKSTYKAVTGR